MTEKRSPWRERRPAYHVFSNPGPNAPQLTFDPSAAAAPASGLRPLAWVIIAWNVLMAVWVVYALANTSVDRSCLTDACRSGAAAGRGIAVVVILFIAACVDGVLGTIYVVTGHRDAPAPPPRPVSGSSSSSIGELAKLVEMHDAGKITDEEFDAAKRRSLGL